MRSVIALSEANTGHAIERVGDRTFSDRVALAFGRREMPMLIGECEASDRT
jgi:hypothetical protein